MRGQSSEICATGLDMADVQEIGMVAHIRGASVTA